MGTFPYAVLTRLHGLVPNDPQIDVEDLNEAFHP